ncbi:MAG: hypothetical protein ACREJO_15600 [Phycisphaerales bacterium]
MTWRQKAMWFMLGALAVVAVLAAYRTLRGSRPRPNLDAWPFR